MKKDFIHKNKGNIKIAVVLPCSPGVPCKHMHGYLALLQHVVLTDTEGLWSRASRLEGVIGMHTVLLPCTLPYSSVMPCKHMRSKPAQLHRVPSRQAAVLSHYSLNHRCIECEVRFP